MSVLIPTSLVMHNFWDFTPASPAHQIEFMNFIKVRARRSGAGSSSSTEHRFAADAQQTTLQPRSERCMRLLSSCQATYWLLRCSSVVTPGRWMRGVWVLGQEACKRVCWQTVTNQHGKHCRVGCTWCLAAPYSSALSTELHTMPFLLTSVR